MAVEDISLIELELIKYKCPSCNYIFKAELFVEKCPSCNFGNNGKFVIYDFFPNESAIDILYSLTEMMKLTKRNDMDIVTRIQAKLLKELNVNFNPDLIKNLLNELYSFEPVVERLKKAINSILNLTDDEEVDKVFSILLSGDNINRLNKSIVILSASLLEILFKDFMNDVITKRTDKQIAQGIMDSFSSKSIQEHLIYTELFLKRKLQMIFEPHKNFLTKWSSLRDDRNKIIHKNSIYIRPKRTYEIYHFAIASVNIFAELNNNLDRFIEEGNDFT